MIDAITNERLLVNGEAVSGSNIVVPLDQLPLVADALTRAGVVFWAREHTPVFADEGDPPVAIVSLSRTSSTADVQRLLDSL